MTCSIDTNSGFCFGVTRAIKAAESELNKGSLYCLGDIVHNGQEVARLEQLGLQTIDYDDLRTLPSHSRVLLRAHGEPPSTYWIAQQRGIEIIDATCPVVKKLQDRIRACYELHKNDEALPPQIVIYGKPGHAEVIGLQGQTNNTAIVIENTEQLDKIDFARPIYLFSQTTKSVEGFKALVEAIRVRNIEISKYRNIEIPFEYHDTISCKCSLASRMACSDYSYIDIKFSASAFKIHLFTHTEFREDFFHEIIADFFPENVPEGSVGLHQIDGIEVLRHLILQTLLHEQESSQCILQCFLMTEICDHNLIILHDFAMEK